MDLKGCRAHIDEDGRVLIPASLRQALGLRSGDTVVLYIENGELRLASLRHRLGKAQKLISNRVGPTISLVDELIAERRNAARYE